jgi:hypothetical protein
MFNSKVFTEKSFIFTGVADADAKNPVVTSIYAFASSAWLNITSSVIKISNLDIYQTYVYNSNEEVIIKMSPLFNISGVSKFQLDGVSLMISEGVLYNPILIGNGESVIIEIKSSIFADIGINKAPLFYDYNSGSFSFEDVIFRFDVE